MKLNELNAIQLANAKIIDAALVNIGLTNPFLRAGELAVLSKETGFVPKREDSYAGTPNARIREVFEGLFDNWSEPALTALKRIDRDFFNFVYGPQRKDLGNTQAGDGYRFRGAFLNQLTGRSNFIAMGKKIGIDLIALTDEQMTDITISAKIAAQFLRDSIVSAQRLLIFSTRYGIVTTSQIKDITQGARIAHNANMGFARLPESDTSGGYQVTMADAPSYLELVG